MTAWRRLLAGVFTLGCAPALGAAPAIGATQPAAYQMAAADLVDGSDPWYLAGIIQQLGYQARLDVDKVGDPLILSSVGSTEFAIVFYGCDERTHDGCELVLFKVGYAVDGGIDFATVNDWNATRLLGRAYLDEVADPWLEMPVVLTRGITRDNFEATFSWWQTSVAAFEAHIGVIDDPLPDYQQTRQFTTQVAPAPGLPHLSTP